MNILILGATSAIAHACARRWAGAGGTRFVLAGRRADALDENAADLRARGAAEVQTSVHDFDERAAWEPVVDQAWATLGTIDIVLVAHGTLPDQTACEADVDRTMAALQTNAVGVIGLLTLVANRMQAQGLGTIALISSVAGDRGRASNYVYGAAKAAVTAFASGLRARLRPSGVHVVTIKPGFVATPMTAGLPLPGPLVASADAVAGGIVAAVARRRDVAYVPLFWWPIMTIIRLIPEAVFKRLKL